MAAVVLRLFLAECLQQFLAQQIRSHGERAEQLLVVQAPRGSKRPQRLSLLVQTLHQHDPLQRGPALWQRMELQTSKHLLDRLPAVLLAHVPASRCRARDTAKRPAQPKIQPVTPRNSTRASAQGCPRTARSGLCATAWYESSSPSPRMLGRRRGGRVAWRRSVECQGSTRCGGLAPTPTASSCGPAGSLTATWPSCPSAPRPGVPGRPHHGAACLATAALD